MTRIKYLITFLFIAGLVPVSCNNGKDKIATSKKDTTSCCMKVPSRFGMADSGNAVSYNGDTSIAGMKLISGGAYMMGGDNNQASPDEYPKHKVTVDAFYMD